MQAKSRIEPGKAIGSENILHRFDRPRRFCQSYVLAGCDGVFQLSADLACWTSSLIQFLDIAVNIIYLNKLKSFFHFKLDK